MLAHLGARRLLVQRWRFRASLWRNELLQLLVPGNASNHGRSQAWQQPHGFICLEGLHGGPDKFGVCLVGWIKLIMALAAGICDWDWEWVGQRGPQPHACHISLMILLKLEGVFMFCVQHKCQPWSINRGTSSLRRQMPPQVVQFLFHGAPQLATWGAPTPARPSKFMISGEAFCSSRLWTKTLFLMPHARWSNVLPDQVWLWMSTVLDANSTLIFSQPLLASNSKSVTLFVSVWTLAPKTSSCQRLPRTKAWYFSLPRILLKAEPTAVFMWLLPQT